jgi:hypothetical protein
MSRAASSLEAEGPYKSDDYFAALLVPGFVRGLLRLSSFEVSAPKTRSVVSPSA